MLILVNHGSALLDLESKATAGLGRLYSPRSGKAHAPGFPWAADNDAFSGWDSVRFRRMLGWLEARPGCLFVTVPDVVADAIATLERFHHWRDEIAGRGFPLALVGQDGAEDLDLPWDDFAAFFVGGSTAWKLSATAEDLCREAKRRGKHIHMGRVNSRRRLRHAVEIGCDSVDGSRYSRYPRLYLAQALKWIRELEATPCLF